MIDNSRDKIEDIKRNLYDPKNKDINHHLEGVLHDIPRKVNKEWEKEEIENKKPKMSILKKFFIASFLFFLLASSYSAYIFFEKDTSVSSEKIDISILGNAFTPGGENLNLLIEITNKNNIDLKSAGLIIEYPSGASDDISQMTHIPKEEIGTIKTGQNITKNITVKLYGEENSVRNIKVSLEYKSEGSNSIFTKDYFYPVTISKAPIILSINAPSEATENQEVSFSVNASINSILPESNVILQIEYPSDFEFIEAIPSPDFGNSIWNLSMTDTSKPLNIIFKGKIHSKGGEDQSFHVYTGLSSSLDRTKVGVVYNSLLHKIKVTKPFLEVNIISPDFVSSGESVPVTIEWVNNTPSKINDAVIIAEVAGDAFLDKSIITKEGFYNSLENKIIWDKNTVPSLLEVGPGQTGSFSFSFKNKSFVGLTNISSNPQSSINVSIRGRQSSTGSLFQNVDNFSNKIVKILSEFQIVSSAQYISGSLPPKADTETKYLVTWSLSNSVNDVSGAVAKTVLPVYVNFDGKSSSTGESLSYNEFTREVTWDIGYVNSGVGINSNREVSFVVSLIPSVSQVGSSPYLLKETSIIGLDTYTNTNIENNYKSISTNSVYNQSGSLDGKVVY